MIIYICVIALLLSLFLFLFFLAALWHDRSSELKVHRGTRNFRNTEAFNDASTFNEIIDFQIGNGNIDNYSLAQAAC